MFMRGGRLGWGFRVGDARAPMSERRNDVEIYGYRCATNLCTWEEGGVGERNDRSMELLGWIDEFMGRRSGFTFCKYEEIKYKVLNYLNSIKR
jgi:hypothetical protein